MAASYLHHHRADTAACLSNSNRCLPVRGLQARRTDRIMRTARIMRTESMSAGERAADACVLAAGGLGSQDGQVLLAAPPAIAQALCQVNASLRFRVGGQMNQSFAAMRFFTAADRALNLRRAVRLDIPTHVHLRQAALLDLHFMRRRFRPCAVAFDVAYCSLAHHCALDQVVYTGQLNSRSKPARVHASSERSIFMPAHAATWMP